MVVPIPILAAIHIRIARPLHRSSYSHVLSFHIERIAEQKYAVRALVTLYRFSTDVPGHADELAKSGDASKMSFANPKRVFKKIQKGVRIAATTTTTALGNVASEIAGRYVIVCFVSFWLPGLQYCKLISKFFS
jgi:hypothetical protein